MNKNTLRVNDLAFDSYYWLNWQIEMGVTELTLAMPQNRHQNILNGPSKTKIEDDKINLPKIQLKTNFIGQQNNSNKIKPLLEKFTTENFLSEPSVANVKTHKNINSNEISDEIIVKNPVVTSSLNIPLGGFQAQQQAETLASSAQNLIELEHKLLHEFQGCRLKDMAVHSFFGKGYQRKPELMVLNDTPNEDEEASGELFHGRAGQLMLTALKAGGFILEKNLYIGYWIYWRPPGNRAPNDSEKKSCLPFLLRQIELLQPKNILLLGKALLPLFESLGMVANNIDNDTVDGIPQWNWQRFQENIAIWSGSAKEIYLQNTTEKSILWKTLLQIKANLANH